MESSAPAKPLWKRMWIYDLPYACPRCGKDDSVELRRFGHNENGTWGCPHCQAKLTIFETRPWSKLVAILPMPTSIVLTIGEPRLQRYLVYFVGILLSFWLSWLLPRPKVALMP